MATTPYARGYKFESRVRAHFVANGYFALRSSQSRTPVDIAVMGATRCFLVQCKADGRCGPREWNALFDLADSVNAMPLIALRKGRKLEFWQMLERKKTERHVNGKLTRNAQPWVQIHVYPNRSPLINRTSDEAPAGRPFEVVS